MEKKAFAPVNNIVKTANDISRQKDISSRIEISPSAKEDEKERELAQTIVDKAKQVSKLVSSLLLLARIDQQRQKFNKEKVDLGVHSSRRWCWYITRKYR